MLSNCVIAIHFCVLTHKICYKWHLASQPKCFFSGRISISGGNPSLILVPNYRKMCLDFERSYYFVEIGPKSVAIRGIPSCSYGHFICKRNANFQMGVCKAFLSFVLKGSFQMCPYCDFPCYRLRPSLSLSFGHTWSNH